MPTVVSRSAVYGGAVALKSDGDLAVFRLLNDGSLDNSFGVAGFVTTDISGSGEIGHSLLIQTDGKIRGRRLCKRRQQYWRGSLYALKADRSWH